jgi:predicted small secreted protein
MKLHRHAALTVSLLLLCAILLGGCGGGRGKRLSKAEFAGKLNTLN